MGLRILENIQLRDRNYLRFEAVAAKLAVLIDRSGAKVLSDLINQVNEFRILGEGSNVLLKSSPFPLLVHVATKGIEYSPQGTDVLVKVQAGENWSALVDTVAARGLYGIETLALIPGSVGAAPVQNIGAYGQEVGNVIEEVEVLNLLSGEIHIFRNVDCEFAYRSSIFKKPESRYDLILSVTMKLSSVAPAGVTETPTQIAERIKQTRRSKLPDPTAQPNVGSFFHNPIVSEADVARLKDVTENMPVFPHGALFKLSAAWLIEQSGWKGYKENGVGVSDKHALVFVNHSSPTAEPLLALAQKVISDVRSKFGVTLTMEPAVF